VNLRGLSPHSVRRILIAAGIALLLIFAIGIYWAGLNEQPSPASSTDVTFHHGVATGHRIEAPSWTAKYERILSNQDQSVLQLYNVYDATIFKKGRPYLHVRAAEMTVNTLTRDFTATGPLHVETLPPAKPRSFDTSAAVWSDADQLLTLPRHTLIYTAAAAPLSVGSLTFNVKSGAMEVRQMRGDVKF